MGGAALFHAAVELDVSAILDLDICSVGALAAVHVIAVVMRPQNAKLATD